MQVLLFGLAVHVFNWILGRAYNRR